MKSTEFFSLKFDGLSIKYAVGNRKEAIVIARGLGEPTAEEDERLIEIFNQVGYTVLIPHYGGSWDSRYGERKFMDGSDNSALSAEKDITDVINALADGKAAVSSHKEILLVGNSFGAPIALMAGAKLDYVKKIVSIGGGICSPHNKYKDRAAMMFNILDKDRDDPNKPWGRNGKNYLGFNLKFTLGFVDGIPANPYDYIDRLATKDIFLVHVKRDRHLLSQRSIDFSKKIEECCRDKGIASRARLEIVDYIINPGNRNTVANHGTAEATSGFYRKLFQFLDPEIDMSRVACVVREVNSKYLKLPRQIRESYGLLE